VKIALATALMLVTAAPVANAQVLNPARFDDAGHVASAGVGMDGSMIAEASYTKIVDGRLAIPVRLLVPLRPTGADFGLGADAQLATIDRYGFGLSGRLDLAFRHDATNVAHFSKLSTSATLLGGFFRERGSAALELGWETGIATHVKPSDEYRREVYPGARATWMIGGNGFFRAGVQGVLRVYNNTEVTLRTGITRTEKLGVLDLMPFYAVIGLNQAF
jgi:hypothetical protein